MNRKITNIQNDKNVKRLPIEAICYQTISFLDELKGFTPDKYSDEACQIACLIFCIVKHISDELESLSKNPSKLKLNETRARDLAEIIQKLYAFLRYIKSSTPDQSPPEFK